MEIQEERKPKNLIAKTIAYCRKNGLKKCAKKIYLKFFRLEEVSYRQWQKGALPTAKDLEKQRGHKFDYEPLISVVVPMYETPVQFAREMIESVQKQTYGHFELCLADGSPTAGETAEMVQQMAAADSRIRYLRLEENQGIAGNTNEALAMAEGSYIALLDHDDLLSPDALYECVKAINADRDTDVLYSDEDKVDMKGKKQFDPHFKPDFNLYLLRTMNYICHLFVVSRRVLDAAGGFRTEYDGAQDYDFIFRCVEQARKIQHIPKILYHWRAHRNSTSENPESKKYAFEAGLRAVKAHYRRMGVHAKVEHGIKYGMYRTVFQRPYDPLISVIIPNKDHVQDLDLCIRTLAAQNAYSNYEIIVVENNSIKKETFAYYKEQESRRDNFRVVTWKEGFNYSAINNFGAGFAKGEYLLLLNNDIEMLSGGCLEDMLGFCMQEGVGIVGAKLFYGDDTVQHAGVVVGLGGVAGHAFVGLPREEYGYMAKAMCTQEMSAVTAACLLVKKSVYEEAGGMTTELAVAFNDVDFCLKVRSLGYLVIYDANAQAYHYESKSRGLENTPEKLERFHREMRFFRDRWGEILEKGDPYYNVNLTLDRNDFTFRNPYWMPVEF